MNLLNNSELSAVFGGKDCCVSMVCTVKETKCYYDSCNENANDGPTEEYEIKFLSPCYDEKSKNISMLKRMVNKSGGSTNDMYRYEISCRSDEVLTV